MKGVLNAAGEIVGFQEFIKEDVLGKSKEVRSTFTRFLESFRYGFK